MISMVNDNFTVVLLAVDVCFLVGAVIASVVFIASCDWGGE